jgi:hypothetical protein
MKVTKITKTMMLKFKTYDFCSADIIISMDGSVGENEDPKEAGTKLTAALMEEVYEYKSILDEVDPLLYARPKSIT